MTIGENVYFGRKNRRFWKNNWLFLRSKWVYLASVDMPLQRTIYDVRQCHLCDCWRCSNAIIYCRTVHDTTSFLTLIHNKQIFLGQLTSAFESPFKSVSYHDFSLKLTQYTLYFIYVGIAQFVAIYVSTVGFIYTGERITQKASASIFTSRAETECCLFWYLGAGEIATRITSDTNLVQEGSLKRLDWHWQPLEVSLLYLLLPTKNIEAYAYLQLHSNFPGCPNGHWRNLFSRFSSQALQSYAVGGSLVEEVISSIRVATAFGTQDRLAKQYGDPFKNRRGLWNTVTNPDGNDGGCVSVVMFPQL